MNLAYPESTLLILSYQHHLLFAPQKNLTKVGLR